MDTDEWNDAEQRRTPFPPQLGGLKLDAITLHEGESTVLAEYLYCGGPGGNRELRLHLLDPASLPEHLEFDAHPGQYERATMANQPITLAHIDPNFGPWDAIIDRDQAPWLRVLTSADTDTSRDWILKSLSEVLSEQ
ncbi:hypothetical protein [Nesterenkonia alkaliphila]|uniref:Uncharacterized protein n=1 Tax=Nesterenkonia alkaliphila TaxID=1463631 RepID=A0A7K1UFJ7_9MICC|nr:hypothetical protein [Nesterenkonia alkaliphila]MVT25238.1 hypothetical protein [Nesterenkonia alkaliphila]GFZ91347.1 hypothetical protein GCM10011359_20840 [Nesterenkonia alkaliphila]